MEELTMRRGRIWVATLVSAALLVPAAAAVAGEVRDPAGGQPAPAAFTHPRVLVSRPQLDVVRQRLAAGAQPWRSAFAQLLHSRYAALDWQARPRATVECGSGSKPDNGCSDEREDALAAYTDALVWYLSRDARYATKAIEILNAWPPVLERHTNSNTMLQTGWAGTGFSRAAELVR